LRFTRALLPAIVAFAAVGYTAVAPRWILGGDNGEFSTLYAVGGIAHPPGYPSMVLWLRLWHWLPVDSAAYGAALATVVLGVLGVYSVQRACLSWGASVGATALASAVYAFSPLTWKLCSHAEAFAMNAMFAGVILTLSAKADEPLRSPTRHVVLLGAVGGLALANHQTIALLAPIGLLAAVRVTQQARRPLAAALAGLGALMLGLGLPYVYVYILAKEGDPNTMPLWIEAPTVAGVFFHFRRGAYGTFSLADPGLQVQPLAHLWHFAETECRQTLGMPILVLAAAGLATVRRKVGTIGRSRLASIGALAAAFALAGPAFIARFNLPFVGAAPTVAERFYLLPEVVLTVMGALSIDVLVPWLLAREGLVAALTLQTSVAASILAVPEVVEHHRRTVDLYVRNTLAAAPANAILVSSGDHRWGGFMYARYALRLRPDVVDVVPEMLAQAWYRKLLQDWTGVLFDYAPDVSMPSVRRPIGPKTLLARLLATGRPVLYTDWLGVRALETAPHYSVGTLMRMVAPGETAPTPEALEAMNVDAFSRYELEADLPEDDHGWAKTLQADYARPWGELAAAFAREGEGEKAAECYARAASLAPWTVRAAR
jgi:hypothetical protein